MPFTTGLLGGFTFTTAVLYLTLATHQKNRANQRALLQSQALLLNSYLDPQPPSALESPRREIRVGVIETAKDTWNEEIRTGVAWIQHVKWGEVGDNVVRGVWSKIRDLRQSKA